MKKRKSYKDKIGDGQLPNLYWVSLSNDYEYLHDGNSIDWIGDLFPFISKGKTIRRPFKTYAAAKRFCDYELTLGETYQGIVVNRINIEDRLSGELYERTRLFYPETAEMTDYISENVRFTAEKINNSGGRFE